MIDSTQAIQLWNKLMRAAFTLEQGLEGITSASLTFGTTGVTLTMIRTMPSGRVANATHILAWDEVVTAKYDMLDALIEDMREKVAAHTEEETLSDG